ncbi:MAG: DUF4242 domain-containing protein [Nitriliruptor sp.]|uniref:DUF4242 domain-containing protein n=1 Tax=Nitriliruptor sp. TaxID=2448056 RepID=UPI0034A05407
MSLFLIEIPTLAVERSEVDHLIERLVPAVRASGASVVESRVTADLKRLFTVVEHDTADADAVRSAVADAGIEVEDVAQVRLVGAELDDVKAEAAAAPRYLVEWDLPAELTMDTYLARKREKSPLYAEVPEVAFRRTYVREDLGKCLCFYDAPCVEDVERARDVVSAPIDRLHELA